MMEKITQWVQEHVTPVIGKVADNAYIGSIAKAFAAFLPLTLTGAVTVLLATFNIAPYQSFIQATGLRDIFLSAYNLTVGLFSIWVAFSLGYYYAKAQKLNSQAFIIGIINVLAFFIANPFVNIDGVNYLSFANLGAQGVFTVMILTPIVVTIYKFCINHNIRIKMPDSVPMYMQNSFSSIIPALFVACVCYALLKGAQGLGYDSLTSLIYQCVGTPLIWIASKPWATCFMFSLGFIMQSCFGIHGNVILSFVTPILQPLMLENIDAYVANQAIPHMYAYSFFTFMDVQVVAVVIVLLLSKKKQFKSLGKLCAFPAIFTVTEPVNFGVPMVFNPYLFIPNLLMPFINFFVISALMAIKVLPYCHAMYVWGLPVLLSGYLQSGVMGVVAQILIIALDVFLFWPFFKAYENHSDTEMEAAE